MRVTAELGAAAGAGPVRRRDDDVSSTGEAGVGAQCRVVLAGLTTLAFAEPAPNPVALAGAERRRSTLSAHETETDRPILEAQRVALPFRSVEQSGERIDHASQAMPATVRDAATRPSACGSPGKVKPSPPSPKMRGT